MSDSKKKQVKQVIVYSTPSCPYCKLAKEFLTAQKIAYKEVNVADDQNAAQEMIQKSGQMSVPVIAIGEQIIVGFNKPALQKALGL